MNRDKHNACCTSESHEPSKLSEAMLYYNTLPVSTRTFCWFCTAQAATRNTYVSNQLTWSQVPCSSQTWRLEDSDLTESHLRSQGPTTSHKLGLPP